MEDAQKQTALLWAKSMYQGNSWDNSGESGIAYRSRFRSRFWTRICTIPTRRDPDRTSDGSCWNTVREKKLQIHCKNCHIWDLLSFGVGETSVRYVCMHFYMLLWGSTAAGSGSGAAAGSGVWADLGWSGLDLQLDLWIWTWIWQEVVILRRRDEIFCQNRPNEPIGSSLFCIIVNIGFKFIVKTVIYEICSHLA